MKQYASMTHAEQKAEYDRLLNEYRAFCDQHLSLDMSRGKPSNEQLELSMPMLDVLHGQHDMRAEGGVDIRNYGQLDGIPEVKRIFADLLEVEPDNIMVGGNSSLNMMFDCINWAEALGIMGCTPWAKLDKVKFLCPVPGYDRHFSICELFGIEMINIPMKEDGPDMDLVREYVENDDSVKGIWCVPKYSNPTGITYSDDVVRAFAALKPAAKDFRIFWDNAYCVHHLSDTPDQLLNIFTACKEQGSEDLVYEFTSSSKISFSGAGIAVVAASKANMADLKSKRTIQTIGPNKVVQLMHARYFHTADGIREHMKKHRALIEPKFNVVLDAFDKELSELGIASYTRPNGGYFISFDTMPGCASRVGELCKQAGVVLTTVGATFPYGKDPEDKNIRVAPTFPSIEELSQAVTLFCLCVKMASLEKLMNA
ncbi:aminotransferase class I/II-fold pyridoxal phosphate-dependent enzyme [Phocea massiliensis]|uniref:Aminotransferase class I/II-fold pyridoxal phosphate-dependent enzyme n=1 Tax=Merdimmobilis hominis TaxID=2897707 RepID=A0A938X753_9FIRM|nr:aminotransferase class I/II-fold pyridoxal phosphate-dependent enzyme [Merdimmobilis hominis]MBM6921737.1 aminotransferase class I/II-fold pyridoxal phosphate-dependent enzyme [Merdimmobilis hominis]